jgi:hypothetical protein
MLLGFRMAMPAPPARQSAQDKHVVLSWNLAEQPVAEGERIPRHSS